MPFYLEKVNNDDTSVEKRLLADWNIEHERRECFNAASDTFAFDMPADPLDEELFPFGQKIRVWKNDKVWFVGWRVDSVWMGSDSLAQLEYQFAGAYEFLFLRKVFQQSRNSYGPTEEAIIAPYESAVILGEKLNGTLQHMADQITEIVNFVRDQTVTEFGSAQFNLGDTFPQFYTPPDPANAITCGEALLKMFRWLGAGTLWFDYSTTPMTLHMRTRDVLPQVSLSIIGAAPKIKRRDDLIPSCIHFQYRITNEINGVFYTEIAHDIACAAGATQPNGTTDPALLTNSLKFQARVGSFDFQGSSISQTVATIVTDDFSPNSLEWWKQRVPELADYQDLALADGPYAQNLPALPNVLVDGIIAPWMQGAAVEAYVGASFSYTVYENPPPNIGGRPVAKVVSATKRVKVTLTNLGSGTYRSGSESPGELIPFGLAKQLYDIEKIAQYQGTYRLVEDEITDPAPVGTALNLLEGRDEWATMAAQVQSVAYDLETCTTDISFGPATHLGEVDLIARLRVARGFRQTVSTGSRSNATSDGGDVVMGENVPKGGTDAAHSKLTALTLIEGIQSKLPNAAGQITIDAQQKLIQLTGHPEDGKITISLPTGGIEIGITAVPVCEGFVNGYRLMLASQFLAGATPPGVGG